MAGIVIQLLQIHAALLELLCSSDMLCRVRLILDGLPRHPGAYDEDYGEDKDGYGVETSKEGRSRRRQENPHSHTQRVISQVTPLLQ